MQSLHYEGRHHPLADAFWLLFDAHAPAVEMKSPYVAMWDELNPWQDLADAPLWRLTRRPQSDPACAPFNNWLEQYQKREHGPMAQRWLRRESYRGQCLVVTAAEARSEAPVTAYLSDWPMDHHVTLRIEHAQAGAIGWRHRARETRFSLVGSGGARLFEIRSLELEDEGWIGESRVIAAACADPNVEDLFQGRVVFHDPNLAVELRPAVKREQARCMEHGVCWRERGRVERLPAPTYP